MCRRVSCRLCGKATWAGCGQHVTQVMAGIPRNDRCQGHTDAERSAARRDSFLHRLLGRG